MTWYDDAMRTIVELPDDQLDALASLCEREGISRAEAVRRAVREFTRTQGTPDSASAFGLWRARRAGGVASQRRLRSEW